MAIHGYTKNYKLIKPQFDTDTWHDYEYDNLDTIDAIMSAIYSSGNWQGFWKKNTHYEVGDVVIDRDTDTMYKVLVEHTTSENTFALERAAHPTYYELWSPNDLAESWAIKMDGVVNYTDYSAKAYAISSALIDTGSAKEWANKTDGTIGTTGEYSAKKHAIDAASSASTATSQASAASASATLAQKWAVDASLIASTDYSAKSWATGSLDAGSAKDWAIKEGGQVGTTGKYSAKVYSLAAENHYEKARDWASKTNGQVESTDYSAKAYAATSGVVPTGSAKEWATSTSIVADGKYGASYYALQAYNANVSAQNNKNLSKDWATKTDGTVDGVDYSSKYYAQQILPMATDIGTLAAISTDISTTASISTDISAVASNETNISAVAGISSDVSTVSGIASDVSTVASNDANISTVATNISDVTSVATNISDVSAVASDLTNINAVSGDLTNIDAVNANKTNIDAVAGNSTNINTVATNISDVNTAATNIAAIQAAPTQASNAAASATLAQNWATKMDGMVDGDYSAKWYAADAKKSRNIGELVKSTVPLTDAGLHLADGSLISGSGSYADFVTYMAALSVSSPSDFTTEAAWQSAVSTYGVCDKYVYDSVNNTIRLPKYGNQICSKIQSVAHVVENTTDPSAHKIRPSIYTYSDNTLQTSRTLTTSAGGLLTCAGSASTSSPVGVYFSLDADLSNSVVSSKCYYYVVIATSTKTDIQVDIDEIATDLNGKADVDLSNINASSSAMQTIAGWGFPDESAGVALTGLSTSNTNFTATTDGFVRIHLSFSNGTESVYLDDKCVIWGHDTGSVDIWTDFIPVKAGTHTKKTSSNASRVPAYMFYPIRGR